jgi:glutamine cyclotransferase
VSLESQYFGEGIAHYPVKKTTRIVQLTYKEQTGIIWDMDLNRLHTFSYETTTSEGWGITYAASHGLFVSDGSEWIMVWDPEQLTPDNAVKELRRFQVKLLYKDADEPHLLARINEMEWDTHSNTLLANIWIQNVLVRIDDVSGYVTHIYDMQQLWPDRPRNVDVFNGIAVTDEPNVVWVTGKWWPNMYKIRLVD